MLNRDNCVRRRTFSLEKIGTSAEYPAIDQDAGASGVDFKAAFLE
jgi:hypothetical protein